MHADDYGDTAKRWARGFAVEADEHAALLTWVRARTSHLHQSGEATTHTQICDDIATRLGIDTASSWELYGQADPLGGILLGDYPEDADEGEPDETLSKVAHALIAEAVEFHLCDHAEDQARLLGIEDADALHRALSRLCAEHRSASGGRSPETILEDAEDDDDNDDDNEGRDGRRLGADLPRRSAR